MKKIIKPQKIQLEQMYLEELMNTYEIAEKLGVSQTTIGKWLRKYEIPVRTNSEAKLKGVVKPSKEELNRMYLVELMTTYKIAEKLGVGQTTIGKWLRKYEIPVKTNSEAKLKGVIKPSKEVLKIIYLKEKISAHEIAEKHGVADSTIGKWLNEYEIPVRTPSEVKLKGVVKPTKKVLEKMYLDDKLNIYEIVEKLEVSQTTIGKWLKEYEIPVRTLSEVKLKGATKPTKEVLERMYLKEKMSTYEIAEKYRIVGSTVRRWLKKYEIPVRTPSETKLKGAIKPTKEVLEKMYLDDKLNTYEISEKLNVNYSTVGNWLKEYEIPVKTLSEVQLNGLIKSTKEVLEKMYLDDKINTNEIAEKLGVGHTTVRNWLKEYGIPVRTLSEAMSNRDLLGEKSPNWKGGLSFLPYCDKFNNRLKEKIRNRDNYTCQNCDVKENGEKHSVHHVNYDKENCYPNLITVCRSCNAKANNNRDEWEIFYMNKLNDRGLLYWTSSNGI